MQLEACILNLRRTTPDFGEEKVSSVKISIPSHFQKSSPISEKHLLLGNSLFPPLLAQDYLGTP